MNLISTNSIMNREISVYLEWRLVRIPEIKKWMKQLYFLSSLLFADNFASCKHI